MDYRDRINKYLLDEVNVLNDLNREAIGRVLDILIDALMNDRKVYIFGNGGSGSTASHFQGDFNKAEFLKTEKRFKFDCLNDNLAVVSAIANDYGYENVFYRQLKGRLNENDIIIALSGSGNSKNVIKAVEYAKKCKCLTIGFTGYDGGKLKKIVDVNVNTNINNIQITEDIHLCLDHLLISMMFSLYGEKDYCD